VRNGPAMHQKGERLIKYSPLTLFFFNAQNKAKSCSIVQQIKRRRALRDKIKVAADARGPLLCVCVVFAFMGGRVGNLRDTLIALITRVA